MPFIPNNPENVCRDQEHNPPTHYVFPPEGGYWVCPNCGKKVIISPSPIC